LRKTQACGNSRENAPQSWKAFGTRLLEKRCPLPGILKSALVYDGQIRRQFTQYPHKKPHPFRTGIAAVFRKKRRPIRRARGRAAFHNRPPDALGRNIPRYPQACIAQAGGNVQPVRGAGHNNRPILAPQFHGRAWNPESGQDFGTNGKPSYLLQCRKPGAKLVSAVMAHGMA
jgi:hypothetical protein